MSVTLPAANSVLDPLKQSLNLTDPMPIHCVNSIAYLNHLINLTILILAWGICHRIDGWDRIYLPGFNKTIIQQKTI